MKNKISIALIEDHPEYREVINLALKEEAGMELTHQFGSSERALSMLQDQTNPPLDIVLLDLNLPGMSGLETIPWLKKYSPETKIIILSQSNREADVVQAIQRGASGYLLKAASVEQIVESIRSVADGGASLDPKVANFILKTMRTHTPKEEAQQALSKRELEILIFIADGLLKKQIADELGISINTVVRHIVHIYEKLGVQNAPAAIAQAYKTGIFPPQK